MMDICKRLSTKDSTRSQRREVLRVEIYQNLRASLLRRTLSICLAVFLLIGGLPVSASTKAQPANTVGTIRLKNGLRIVLREEHAFPMISCQMWYHVGSINDPAGLSGTCHVVEHILTDSIKSGASQLAGSFVGAGGRFDAFTSDDFTVFIENLPSKELDLALSMQAHRLGLNKLDENQLQLAKKQVISEISGSGSPAEITLSREVRALAYSRHPYKNLPAGMTDELERLTLPVVSQFIKSNFNPQNATLVLSGDFDALTALQSIQTKMGAIPGAATPVPQAFIPHEPKQAGEKRVYIKHAGSRNHLLAAFRGPDAEDEDAPGIAVLESLLGDESYGLLKEHFIDTNLCDRATTAFELRKQPGIVTVSLRGKGGVSGSKLLTALDHLCDQVKNGGFDNEMQDSSRSRAVFSFLKHRSGPYQTAFQLGFFDSLGKVELAQRWQTRLQAVRKTDLVRVANRYLNQSNRSVGLLISKPNEPQKNAIACLPENTSEKEVEFGFDLPIYSEQKLAPQLTGVRTRAGYSGDMVEIAPIERASEALHVEKARPGSALQSGAVSQAQAQVPTQNKGTVQPSTQPESAPSTGSTVQKGAGTNTAPPQKNPAQKVSTPAKSQSVPAEAGQLLKKGLTAPIEAVGAGVKVMEKTAAPQAGKLIKKGLTVPIEAVGAGVKVLESNAAPQAGKVLKGIAAPIQAVGEGVGRALDPRSGQNQKQDGQVVSKAILPNGITLIVHYVASSPAVRIVGSIAAGEAYDPSDKHGLADLNVALMNGDSEKISRDNSRQHQLEKGLSPEDLIKIIPGREHIKIKTTCLARDVDVQMKLLSHHLLSPVLTDESIKTAKEFRIHEIKEEYRRADRKVTRLLLSNLIDSSSGFSPANPQTELDQMNNISLDDVTTFRQKCIEPSRMTLVMSGSLPMSQARNAVLNAFKEWKQNTTEARAVLTPNKRKTTKVVSPVETGKSLQVALGKLIDSNALSDEMLVADCALYRHPFFSRLLELRRNAGAGVEVDCAVLPLSTSSAWLLRMSMPENRVKPMTATLKKSLGDFSSTGINANELLAVRRFLPGHMAVTKLSDVERASETILDYASSRREPTDCFTTAARLEGITLESVNQFIKTKFQPIDSCIVVSGDKKAIKLVPSLASSN